MDINGLWTAQFAALSEGVGVMTIQDGNLSGGDSGYYYYGSYQQDGNRVTGKIRVVHYAGALSSAFGPLRELEVSFVGLADDDLIMAQGRALGRGVPPVPLAISLRRVARPGDFK
ncbi:MULTISPECIES: GrlR family regulatory protein [unclassified Bradyrhizobium]|uniref:GrlR family regulatory protein n=1 Tax=unclassified Bradyrhizobium TaxID=2631580 RepID=UPI0028E7884E|nr:MULTISPECIES: GrlR family regulatory protein [unclassified Bradyrhizobium]